MNQKTLQTYQFILTRETKKGFTLIELLVVIIILGVLSAVALPNLIQQIGKAREVEAKEHLSSIGTAQQAYFFENRQFASTMNDLNITISGEYYNYLSPQLNSTGSWTQVTHVAEAINPVNQNIRDYAMGIYFQNQSFGIVLCQSNNPGDNALPSSTTVGTCQQGQQIQ